MSKPTKPEQKAWTSFNKQVPMAFVTLDERVEDAYRAGFRAAKALADAAVERKAKRKKR